MFIFFALQAPFQHFLSAASTIPNLFLDHFPGAIVKHKHDPKPLWQARLLPISELPLQLRFQWGLTGTATSSLSSVGREPLSSCEVLSPWTFASFQHCSRQTCSSSTDWPPLNKAVWEHARKSEWSVMEGERKEVRLDVRAVCIAKCLHSCMPTPLHADVFISSKLQPSSSTFSLWLKKRIIKLYCGSVVQRGL